jgi:phenylacetic acid degradation operon negative regulatory protein
MKPKTQEFLYFLLWNCECLMRPTWRNLSSSFESWAYRNGFLRQIERLRQADLIQLRDDSIERVCRLTEAGRRYVLGGRDPERQWKRRWDGKWRLVLFDIPLGRDVHRVRLRRYLRQKGFGYLQNSVWISPDPVTEERSILDGGKISV